MPGLGGIPLLEALRRIDPKVPALLTSSCEESELEQLSARFTFTDYAVKPWNHARVARQILASIARCPAPGTRRSVGRTRLRS
jgi:CheY-like chemotaxis protein